MSGRLFEILYHLLDVKQTTAKELADHFEVSVRTIYRDLDRLLVAGIPIITTQGNGGGVAIDSQFVLDKTLLKRHEQEQILSAIQSLSSLQLNEYQTLLKHMKSVFQHEMQDWIQVDFSSWHKNQEMNDKFELLKKVILKHQMIAFDYVNMQGEKTYRFVYPIKIFFKGNAWYLQAYENDKEAYRTYKLSRMNNMKLCEEFFDHHQLPELPTVIEYHEESSFIHVVLKFQKYLGSFVYDEFEYKDIEELEDCYVVKTQLNYYPWFLSFLLSFGKGVEVVEPLSLREDLKNEVLKIIELY